MWDFREPGIKPVAPSLASGLLSTAPPEMSNTLNLDFVFIQLYKMTTVQMACFICCCCQPLSCSPNAKRRSQKTTEVFLDDSKKWGQLVKMERQSTLRIIKYIYFLLSLQQIARQICFCCCRYFCRCCRSFKRRQCCIFPAFRNPCKVFCRSPLCCCLLCSILFLFFKEMFWF